MRLASPVNLSQDGWQIRAYALLYDVSFSLKLDRVKFNEVVDT